MAMKTPRRQQIMPTKKSGIPAMQAKRMVAQNTGGKSKTEVEESNGHVLLLDFVKPSALASFCL
jgi:hypothetical protein